MERRAETTTGPKSRFPVQAHYRDVKLAHLPSGFDHGRLSFAASQTQRARRFPRSVRRALSRGPARPLWHKSRAKPVSLSAPGGGGKCAAGAGLPRPQLHSPPPTARPPLRPGPRLTLTEAGQGSGPGREDRGRPRGQPQTPGRPQERASLAKIDVTRPQWVPNSETPQKEA